MKILPKVDSHSDNDADDERCTEDDKSDLIMEILSKVDTMDSHSDSDADDEHCTEDDFEDSERDRKFTLESDLVEHDHLIKYCLQLTSADVNTAIELMNSFRELKYTKFMLIKYPVVVDTMKKLRRYVGCTKNWRLTDEQKQEFDERAGKVRNLAVSIYNSFIDLFDVPEAGVFSHIFNEQVLLFKEKTSHLTPYELVNYVDDEGDS